MPVPIPDSQSAEQTMNMSPMDLFDSIFWGMFRLVCCQSHRNSSVADPYPTNGLDPMGFDYIQQLYPQF